MKLSDLKNNYEVYDDRLLYNQVNHQVINQVLNRASHQVINQIWKWNRASHPFSDRVRSDRVRIQIWDKVINQVEIKGWNPIRDSINERNLK